MCKRVSQSIESRELDVLSIPAAATLNTDAYPLFFQNVIDAVLDQTYGAQQRPGCKHSNRDNNDIQQTPACSIPMPMTAVVDVYRH